MAINSLSGLVLHRISKSYGTLKVLNEINLQLIPGSINVILGPSGSGKSSLLHIIAGLEKPDHGDVIWDGVSQINKPTHRRNFGLMFQDYALFPHLNVYENIAFGLKTMHRKPEEVKQRVGEVLKLVDLQGFEKRNVHNLSGGEAQRVALARALAPEPCFLMLDEPLGSLDQNLREKLIDELRSILTRMHLTALYVTHNQEEAFRLAEKIFIMRNGNILQEGEPQAIYSHPADVFVARFLGLVNIIPATAAGLVAQSEIGKVFLPQTAEGAVNLLIRPDQIYLDDQGEHQMEGWLIEKTFLGTLMRIEVQINGIPLVFLLPSHAVLPETSTPILLSYNPGTAVQILPNELISY